MYVKTNLWTILTKNDSAPVSSMRPIFFKYGPLFCRMAENWPKRRFRFAQNVQMVAILHLKHARYPLNTFYFTGIMPTKTETISP